MKTLLALSPLVLAALAAALPDPAAPWAIGPAPAAPPPPAAYVDGPLVSLGGGLSHGAVLAGAPGEVFLSLELTAADPPDLPRQTMNLALVLDRSGSMASEQKLEHAKSAADQLVARLLPRDRLAVVAYDSEVRTVVPSTPASERHLFHGAIASLVPGGSTDLHGGMVAGYEEVRKHFDPAGANRVLLISDGLANHGVSDPDAIRARAARCREQGVRIATMGVGLRYDEVLMGGVAEAAGGQYHYVDDPEGIAGYLERELEALGRVVAKDVRVTLRLADGVSLAQVFGYDHVRADDTVEVAMADLLAGERRKLVVRLSVSPGAAVERPVAAVSLRCTDAAATATQRVELPPLSVHGTTLAEVVHGARDLAVLAQVEVVRNAEVLDEAMRHQRDGRLDEARALLLARHAESLARNESEYASPEVARILDRMQAVAGQMERARQDAPALRDMQLLNQLRALGYMKSN